MSYREEAMNTPDVQAKLDIVEAAISQSLTQNVGRVADPEIAISAVKKALSNVLEDAEAPYQANHFRFRYEKGVVYITPPWAM